MPNERDDGAFDLAAEVAAGHIEIIQPGTEAAAAFEREMLADLDAMDAELRQRDGPEAMTSDRLLRQAAISAERAPEFVGYAFASWCRARGWDRADLASWLGVTADQLAALAIEQRRSSTAALADRYGADRTRLATVLE